MPELTLRPIVSCELPEILALHRRAQIGDSVPEVLELAELEEELDDAHVVLATDTRVVEIDGELVGYANTHHLPSDVGEERCFINGEVDPAFRRRGVGTALLEWGIERASAQLRTSTNQLPKYVRVDSYDFIRDAHALYAKVGFVPVRYMEELLRPLVDLPLVTEIDGITIVPWPDGRDEEIRVEKNTAFADHWGTTPTTAERWDQMVRGFAGRPDLSFIALDADDVVVGHCLNTRYEADDELIGRRDGWIQSLGTLAEWRGRGIGSAMITRSLDAFAAANLTHASIGVDSENPTGAAQLYRSLGFVQNQRSITHQIEL